MPDKIIRDGAPYPLGATWDAEGVNFSLFSAHASKVELCLYDSTGVHETARLVLPAYTDEVWSGFVPGIDPGTLYGYRVHGAYEPEAGQRFNPHKLLLDPYARAHFGTLQWDDAVFGYQVGGDGDDLTFDTRDSAPFMPKSIVIDPNFEWHNESNRPRTPWEASTLYELHVRGFTMKNGDVLPHQRGTFAGLSAPHIIDYIRRLGVTSVELLPVHAFINDRHLLERGLTNYWGYNSIGFFAPDVRYAADPANSLREFKEMVARFHDAGLEVILDVVYNHTAEGNELGPTLSFKGIDNVSYYRLAPDRARYYSNDAGTGNTLNLRHRRVMQMVTDSLRYWVTDMHVDGFRFDLGTVLARDAYNFDDNSGFFAVCAQDPVLATVRLIAEPWDCGPGGYQVGSFPPGWAEWNDTFRDVVRDYWRTQASAGGLASRLCASSDVFNNRGRRPWASINFVTTHDGFTMRDVVSYDDKHNEANGDDNRDGSSNNRSHNWGVEGPTDDQEIVTLRDRQARNHLATLLFAQGTPMLLAGDEFGRTQGGNNNAYCQDNDLSWIDWQWHERDVALQAFVQQLIAIRKAHPLLSQTRFLNGEVNPQTHAKDVAWLNRFGAELTPDEWGDFDFRCFGMLLDGRALANGADEAAAAESLLIIMNPEPEPVRFMVPTCACRPSWKPLVDTARLDVPGDLIAGDDAECIVEARSLVLLVAEPLAILPEVRDDPESA